MEDNGTAPAGPGLSSSGSSPSVSPPDGASIPSAERDGYRLNYMDGTADFLAADACRVEGDYHVFYFERKEVLVAPPRPPGLIGRLFGRSGIPEQRHTVTHRDWIVSIRSDRIHSLAPAPASGIAAHSDETPQEVRPEGQEPGGEAETPNV
jgi:hypothetical protein